MTRTYVPQAAPIIFGSLFLGFWLIFGIAEEAPAWMTWGFVGLAIAGGLYAARMFGDLGKMVAWSAIGITLGGLVYLLFVQPDVDIIAFLITTFGASLIVSALPRPGEQVAYDNPPAQQSAPRSDGVKKQN